MDKRKKIVLIILAVVVICLLLMRGCVHLTGTVLEKFLPSAQLGYDHPELYTADTVGNTGAEVNDIEIEWGNGDVTVCYGDVEGIQWQETFLKGEKTEDNMLHYYVDTENHKLELRYCCSQYVKDGNWKISKENKSIKGLEKTLAVILPRGSQYGSIEVVGINGNHSFDVDAQNMELSAVNGSITLTTRHAEHLEMQTVNGNLTVMMPETVAFAAKLDKVNGAFYTDFNCTRDGDKYLCGSAPYTEIEMNLINGNMNIIKIQ